MRDMNQPYVIKGKQIVEGEQFGSLIYIGDTGKRNYNGSRILLFFNVNSNKYEEKPQSYLLKGICNPGLGSGAKSRVPRTTSKYHVGVRKRRNKFNAVINVNHEETNIGTFNDVNEATNAWEYCNNKLSLEDEYEHINTVINEARIKYHANIKIRSGEKGVYFVKCINRWTFNWKVNGKKKRLGCFKTFEDARAYKRRFLGGNN